MALKSLLILSLQACFIQMALTQCANYGPSQLGINPGPQLNLAGGLGLGPNPGNNPANLAAPYFNPSYGVPASTYGVSGPYGPGSSYGAAAFPGYGGSGSGDVAVAGELPVVGSTLVAGQVPVTGGVQFGGQVPAAGVITITGSCSCNGY